MDLVSSERPDPDGIREPRLPDLETVLTDDEFFRVQMTVSCRDTDGLPKVDGAGEVVERDGTRVQVMHNGLLIEEGCYYGPWMTHVIHGLRGHHEPQEEMVVEAVLRRLAATGSPATAVELGSFWAYYSMWFLRAVPTGRVVAMEPDPGWLDVGKRNLALNGLEATFVHGAVGPHPGSPTSFPAESSGEFVEVVQHDLDSLLSETGVEHVDLLLCDIQGFETVLLERARASLAAGKVRFLILSTHHHFISGDPLTHQRARDLLAELGAHVICEHSVSESFSGDGLIAVSFDPRDRDLTVQISLARSLQSLFGESERELARVWAERDAAAVELNAARLETAAAHERCAVLESELAEANDRLRATSTELYQLYRRPAWRQLAAPVAQRVRPIAARLAKQARRH